MKLEEIIDDVDGLCLATEKFISNSLKNGDNSHEVLALIAEELDNISTKLNNLKKDKKI